MCVCVRVCVCGRSRGESSRIRIKHTCDSSRALVFFWLASGIMNSKKERKKKRKKRASNGACYSDSRSELCAAWERLVRETKRPTGCMSERMDGDGAPGKGESEWPGWYVVRGKSQPG